MKLESNWAPWGGVNHLGMELDAVEAALVVGDGGERRALADPHHPETLGQGGHAVTVAHPHQLVGAGIPDAIEDGAGGGDLEDGGAVFPMIAALDPAAELGAHGLLAVADAEHRHAQGKHRFRRARGVLVGDRGRTAGQNHRLGAKGADAFLGDAERVDFTINTTLPHPPGDELGHLRPEIKNENAIGGHGRSSKLKGNGKKAV